MQRRSRKLAAIVAALVGATAAFAEPAGARQRPDTIELPTGFAPEGVATGAGGTFYVGTRTGGHVARGNIHDEADAEVFVDDPVVNAATGLKADVRHGLLWVAGGPTGQAAVYDLDTGDAGVALTLTTKTPSFINDVVVTRDAAYFTNSNQPELYKVPISPRGELGAVETIPLAGRGPGRRLRQRLQPQRHRRHERRPHAARRQQHDGRALHDRPRHRSQRADRPRHSDGDVR